jgi:hypothetical protein
MKSRLSRRLVFVLAWVISVTAAGALGRAAAQRSNDEPAIVSGADIGFRIDGIDSGVRKGRLVVRVDGKWVDAEVTSRMHVRPIK